MSAARCWSCGRFVPPGIAFCIECQLDQYVELHKELLYRRRDPAQVLRAERDRLTAERLLLRGGPDLRLVK
jgi:hypothetical protein